MYLYFVYICLYFHIFREISEIFGAEDLSLFIKVLYHIFSSDLNLANSIFSDSSEMCPFLESDKRFLAELCFTYSFIQQNKDLARSYNILQSNSLFWQVN